MLVRDGVVAAVGPEAAAAASADADIVDLGGWLLMPAAVEPHAHLDKAFLAELVENPTGDLLGAIEAMGKARHLLGVEETIERAERAARLMARNGYVAVRTHADLTVSHGMRSIEALVEVKRRVAELIDVEIVALCGWPATGPDNADQRALLREAMAGGADLVGGCPHLEVHSGVGTIESATEFFLEVATEFGVGVDLHTDETLDPAVAGLEFLARRVLAGFSHPVTASHCVSLGMQPETQQRATAELVAEAGIGVITLPHTNLFLQGRGQHPMPRGLTAVGALRAAGVRVAAGADNVQDPFNPVGRLDPFETAGLMVMANHDLPAEAWAAVSTVASDVAGRPGACITQAIDATTAEAVRSGATLPEATLPGAIQPGAIADLFAVPADSLREAIALAPADRRVWRRGCEPC